MKNYIKILAAISFITLISGCNWFSSDSKVKKWDECTLASCWNGANASQRMMNMLSPGMSDSKFTSYMEWMKGRGCNTAHLFVSNKGDGENAGYSIYGTSSWDWIVDDALCEKMTSRIKKLQKNGFGTVIWLFADDSSAWNKEAKKNFPKYLQDLKAKGFTDLASTIVIGLELDEYYNANEVASLVSATKSIYSGKIGTHQTSGRYDYCKLADICFYQVNPGKSVSWIKNEAKRIKALTGKPLNFFEIERNPSPEKCQAALDGGAFGVGNY